MVPGGDSLNPFLSDMEDEDRTEEVLRPPGPRLKRSTKRSRSPLLLVKRSLPTETVKNLSSGEISINLNNNHGTKSNGNSTKTTGSTNPFKSGESNGGSCRPSNIHNPFATASQHSSQHSHPTFTNNSSNSNSSSSSATNHNFNPFTSSSSSSDSEEEHRPLHRNTRRKYRARRRGGSRDCAKLATTLLLLLLTFSILLAVLLSHSRPNGIKSINDTLPNATSTTFTTTTTTTLPVVMLEESKTVLGELGYDRVNSTLPVEEEGDSGGQGNSSFIHSFDVM